MTTPQINVPDTPPDPLAPQPTFRATFYAYLQQLVTAFGDANTAFTWMNGRAATAETSAEVAGNAATQAATSVAQAETARDAAQAFAEQSAFASNAAPYATGGTYAIGETVYSPVTQLSYRNNTGANGGIDPSLDPTNWAAIEFSELSAFVAAKAEQAVDVFVYDTSRDSDGGAWRKRTSHTSWYNETLNTATRGSRREFPAVAVIVAEASKFTIYDGDDPSLPMWKVFQRDSGKWPSYVFLNSTSAVVARDGKICTTGSSNAGPANGAGVRIFDFVADRAEIVVASFGGITGWLVADLTDATFNALTSSAGMTTVSIPSRALLSGACNDVAMTVLPGAPIDPATGLPVPTIAVATNGGVSVITDTGAVYDSASTFPFKSVAFDDLYTLYAARSQANYLLMVAGLEDYTSADAFGDVDFISYGGILLSSLKKGFAWNKAVGGGFSIHDESPVLNSSSMRTEITSTYNTGWMPGDIKGAFLSDTSTDALVGGTDNDRSVNNNPLTVVGTITRTPVAPGADTVAYSGFSSTNYLQQPYNPDLDFGTGDCCVMWWSNVGNSGDRTPIHLGDPLLQTGIRFDNSGAFPKLFSAGVQYSFNSAIPTNDSTLKHFCWVFNLSVGVGRLYLNGELVYTSAPQGEINLSANTDRVLTVGARVGGGAPFNGSLALLRISATEPTAEAIKKIYEDERPLFQDGAQSTIYGTSDTVTALAHDPVTGLLHVGTSQGRSDFQGLRRVSNTTTPVGTAISAVNGMIAED